MDARSELPSTPHSSATVFGPWSSEAISLWLIPAFRQSSAMTPLRRGGDAFYLRDATPEPEMALLPVADLVA